ncbi:GyrI-like domain-containing protein [Miniphocaeibacter massiliensis]|uniref:GyrI-like domain-containing protein n=1 Tax=Miniphocaeibacter massiliensis TaxID=2041841 RepID=UPI000C06EEDE|nr:GyrI-like domain-containing protein [Miniphocaeibacter massiliensis]
MKYEWRKKEKEVYLPKEKAVEINVPKFKYYTVKGCGNPNGETFKEAVGALYAMSYGIRMMPKNGVTPEGYFEYTVYPLEGVWDLNKNGRKSFKETGSFSKNDLTYKLMIRQPDFVTEVLAKENIEKVSKKKPNDFNNLVKFEEIEEGLCVQILHKGSYDTESSSFGLLDEFCKENNLKRLSMVHKEIYLTDPRKSEPEKQKTVLRYCVEKSISV